MRICSHNHNHHEFFLIIIFCWVIQQEIIVVDAWQLSVSRQQQHYQTIRPFPFRHVDSSRSHLLLYSVRTSGNDNNNDEDDYQGGSGGDPVLRLPLMEAKLATLMEEEEGQQQQQKNIIEKLQADISNAKTSAEFGVRKSQSEFYDAFATADINAMSKIWSDISPIRCVHPGMSSINGRQQVMESWKEIFQSATTAQQQQQSSFSRSTNKVPKTFEIEPSRTQIDICGGLTAICSCVEKTQGGGELEVINIYKRENGCWKMTLHHAGPVVMRSSSSSSAGGGGATF